MIGPSKAASKVDLGKTRRSKPQMVGTVRVPFWINLGDDSAVAGNGKTKRAKPLMTGMVCPFFGAAPMNPQMIPQFLRC